MEILDQDYAMLPVASLRPHPHNPNVGDEEALAASVDASGFYGAVTVRPHPDEEGAYQILAGEHRWRLAARRGKTEIPAIVLQDIDDVQAVRILLDDNEVTRRGTYDKDALDRAIESLGDIEDPLFSGILSRAGEQKDDEDAANQSPAPGEPGSNFHPYSDDSDSDSDYVQEFGVLVMCESELEQQSVFEYLAKTYGASKLRVVSV